MCSLSNVGAGQSGQIWALVSACGSLAKQNSWSHCTRAHLALLPSVLASLLAFWSGCSCAAWACQAFQTFLVLLPYAREAYFSFCCLLAGIIVAYTRLHCKTCNGSVTCSKLQNLSLQYSLLIFMILMHPCLNICIGLYALLSRISSFLLPPLREDQPTMDGTRLCGNFHWYPGLLCVRRVLCFLL